MLLREVVYSHLILQPLYDLFINFSIELYPTLDYSRDHDDFYQRAWFYCRVCHENLDKLEHLKRCSCKKLAKARFEYFNKENRGKIVAPPHLHPTSRHSPDGLRRRKVTEEKESGRQETAKVEESCYRSLDKSLTFR